MERVEFKYTHKYTRLIATIQASRFGLRVVILTTQQHAQKSQDPVTVRKGVCGSTEQRRLAHRFPRINELQ